MKEKLNKPLRVIYEILTKSAFFSMRSAIINFLSWWLYKKKVSGRSELIMLYTSEMLPVRMLYTSEILQLSLELKLVNCLFDVAIED